jgi:hypothetical protein
MVFSGRLLYSAFILIPVSLDVKKVYNDAALSGSAWSGIFSFFPSSLTEMLTFMPP